MTRSKPARDAPASPSTPSVPASVLPSALVSAPPASAYALAGLLAAAGTAHLTRPAPFDRIVPRCLPGPARRWTYVSGLAELALAASLAHPRTRPAAAAATAALFVAVFPANAQMAADWRNRGTTARTVAYARLPLQLPLIAWAWRVRRAARPNS